MPNIDTQKLRRFHAEWKSAVAARRQAWDAVKDARQNVSHARLEADRFQSPAEGYIKPDPESLEGGWRGRVFHPPATDHEKAAVHALEKAKAALTRAEEEHERLSDICEHASRIWSRCRDFAASHDALPHDLKD